MKYNNKCKVKLMNLSSGKIHQNGLPSYYVSLCLTSAWKTIYGIYGCNEMSSSMVIQQNHSAIFLSIIFFQCVPCWGDFRLKFNTSIVWTKQILFVTKFFSESLIPTWKRWRINRKIMETIGHDCIFVYYFNFTVLRVWFNQKVSRKHSSYGQQSLLTKPDIN